MKKFKNIKDMKKFVLEDFSNKKLYDEEDNIKYLELVEKYNKDKDYYINILNNIPENYYTRSSILQLAKDFELRFDIKNYLLINLRNYFLRSKTLISSDDEELDITAYYYVNKDDSITLLFYTFFIIDIYKQNVRNYNFYL